MPLRKADKFKLTQEYNALLSKAEGLTVFDYRGLSVDDFTTLRSQIRENKGQIKVVKNRMLKRALEDKPYKDLQDYISGPCAVIFTTDDPILPAKTLVNFAKDHEAIQIRGGMASQTVLDAGGVEELSKTPSQEELYAKILGGIKAPASNILGGVKGLHQKLHGLMKSYTNKLEEQGE